MLVTLRRERTELKAIKLGANWFQAIDRFLDERPSTGWLEQKSAKNQAEVRSSVRLAERIVSFRVQRETKLGGQRTISLDALVVRGFDEVWEGLGLRGAARARVQELFDIDHGLVVVSGTSDAQLNQILSMVRVLGRGLVVEGDFRARWPEIKVVAETDPIFVSTVTGDPVEAMGRLRAATGTGCLPATWRGVLTLGIIERVCVECAKETAVDPELLKMLPQIAVPRGRTTYVVGRRCDACAQSGYRGVVALSSSIVADNFWFELNVAAMDQGRAYALAVERGVRPLLIEGAERVFSGETTLTALFQVTKVIPDGFVSYLGTYFGEGAGGSKQASSEKLDIPGDFFGQEAPVQPLQGRAAFANNAPNSAAAAAGDRAMFAQPKRAVPQILVVEDDPDQRSILEMVLKAVPYEVRSAVDGRAGVEECEREVPDLIITDLMMPRLDGAAFVRELKKLPAWRTIPVVVLTVVADGDKEYELLDLGVDDYCEKTVQRKILLKRIQNVLRRRAQA